MAQPVPTDAHQPRLVASGRQLLIATDLILQKQDWRQPRLGLAAGAFLLSKIEECVGANRDPAVFYTDIGTG